MSVKLKKSKEETIGLTLLVGEVLSREIDASILQLVSQPDLLELLCEIEPACRDYIQKEWSADEFESAAVEFCDLFIMPESTTAPRAAAWLELGCEVTADSVDAVVREFLTEWKIQVPPAYQYLAYDHISLILYVSAVILQAHSDQSEEFDEITLDSWVPSFAASLAKVESPLYKAAGVLLQSLRV
jgi:TorA maturation chaperone TorD